MTNLFSLELRVLRFCLGDEGSNCSTAGGQRSQVGIMVQVPHSQQARRGWEDREMEGISWHYQADPLVIVGDVLRHKYFSGRKGQISSLRGWSSLEVSATEQAMWLSRASQSAAGGSVGSVGPLCGSADLPCAAATES